MNRRLFLPFLALLPATTLTAQVLDRSLTMRPWSNYTTVPSRTWTSPAENVEAADDFDLHAMITRVRFDGNGCFNCASPTVTGATVRFYAWNNGVPGALQHEVLVTAGSPHLAFQTIDPTSVEVTLPAPFLATGRHFVSMQLHFQGGGYWAVWCSSYGNPNLAGVKVKNHLTGGGWVTPPINSAINTPLLADLTFELFGLPTGGSAPVPIPCLTWTETPTAIAPGTTHTVWRAVKAFAVDDVWAVGEKYMPQGGISGSMTTTVHWDGTRWSEVPSPNPGPNGLENSLLYGLDGVASNDLWAAGLWTTSSNGGWTGPQVFAMHWEGTTWTQPPNLPLPNNSVGAGVTGSRIYDVKAIATDDVWFAGFWIDVVSASSGQTTRPGFLGHWDGSTFTRTTLPIVSGQVDQFFAAVDATGPNDVWLAGGSGTNPTSSTATVPVLFHFDGSTWTHTPCAMPNLPGWRVQLNDVAALSPNDVYVFGYRSTQSPTPQVQYFLSHWNGNTWSLLPAPPEGGAVAVLSASDMWIAGARVWHFDGSTWSVVQEFPAANSPSFAALDATSACEVVGVGAQVRIGQSTPFAARIDAPWHWRSEQRLPSDPALAPGHLRVVAPPRLGNPLTVELGDPRNVLAGGGGIAFWVASAQPAPGHPMPAAIPFGGLGGGPGEAFLDLAAIGYVSGPVVLTAGAGQHSVVLPSSPSVLGMDLFTQGVVFATSGSGAWFVGNGLDLHLGL